MVVVMMMAYLQRRRRRAAVRSFAAADLKLDSRVGDAEAVAERAIDGIQDRRAL